MLTIQWLASAEEDLTDIITFIAADNPAAALRLRMRIEESVSPVAEHPYLYKISDRVPGCREIVAHPNYVVFYRVTQSCIEVVNVIHARRQWPPIQAAQEGHHE